MTDTRLGERVLGRLVRLAQEQPFEAPFRDRQVAERLDERIEQWRGARKRAVRARAITLAAAFAACMVLGFVCLPLFRTPALHYEVARGTLVGGYIEGGAATRVRFSDGSELALGKGARARVGELTPHGALVELGRGELSLNVVKAEQTAWRVQAGPYTVRVTGTSFDVRWSTQARRFELDLHHGSVVVSGPSIRGTVTLEAGQRLVGSPEKPASVSALAANTPPRANAPPQTSAASATVIDVANPSASAATADDAAPERPRDTSRAAAWAHLVAQGQFEQVLDAVRRAGLQEVLTSGSLPELAALADAARYARDRDLAKRALLSERKRFPHSGAARDAAFFLGGLEDDSGRAALDWYERYLAESPRGAYTSQALGRRLLLYYRQQGRDAATPLAHDYLERYPTGPYASVARKILDRSER